MADVADQLGNDIPLQEIGGSRQNRVQNERVNGDFLNGESILTITTIFSLVLGSLYQLEDAIDNLDEATKRWKAIVVIAASVLAIVLSVQLLVKQALN